MTSETQIEAGPELDSLIALEVMGWDPPRADREYMPDFWFDASGWRDDPTYRAFSSEWEGMGLVLERMQALGWEWDIESEEGFGWWCGMMQRGTYREIGYAPPESGGGGKIIRADTLPHAVTLAALAAVRAS